MNELTAFNFNNMPVRISIVDDEPKFHANDVCQILDYGNPHQALKTHVQEDDLQKLEVIDSLGRKQLANFVNEAGLYALILGSEKPEAKPFQRWVTHDVLPSIRKTGTYIQPKAKQSNPLKIVTDAARAFTAVQRMIKSLGCDTNAAAISANQVIRQTAGINLLEMAGQTHLLSANQENFYTPTELGKTLGVSARAVNLLLAEAGLQMKRGEVWEVTEAGKEFARIYDTGKKHGSGVPITQIKWSTSVLDLIKHEKEVA